MLREKLYLYVQVSSEHKYDRKIDHGYNVIPRSSIQYFIVIVSGRRYHMQDSPLGK